MAIALKASLAQASVLRTSRRCAMLVGINGRSLVSKPSSRSVVVAVATKDEPSLKQPIQGLDTNYCDDFQCTSSPAIEQTVRAFGRDIIRLRTTASLFNKDIKYSVSPETTLARIDSRHGFHAVVAWSPTCHACMWNVLMHAMACRAAPEHCRHCKLCRHTSGSRNLLKKQRGSDGACIPCTPCRAGRVWAQLHRH
jgi:hypothetical protein